MMELSLAGLIGAFLGTAVAALAYAPLLAWLERSFRARAPCQSSRERNTLGQEMSLLRRAVLVADIAVFAGTGYWLATMLAG